VKLNAAFGDPLDWMGSTTLLVKSVPAKLAPAGPESPIGPHIQEHDPAKGKASGMATFQDLLQNGADEAKFAHYAQAQLLRVDLATLQARPIGAPGIFGNVSPAPDGKHLLVGLIHKPFSFLVTADRFPQRCEIWDLQGKVLHTLADLPLAEDIPLDGVRKGPRGLAWVPTAPATLHWTEALDEGNPKAKVPHRDRLMILAAPFNEAKELLCTEHRMGRASWTEDGRNILIAENDREKRWTRTWLQPIAGGQSRKLWNMSALDRYRNPGLPVQRLLPSGHAALRLDGGALWLSGQGATPAGNRPFLDRLELVDLKTSRVFQCLANADLFKCGIARSGAYNRTLTPFGFQSERRSLWEAPEMYLKVSPFMKADKFSAPVLLIHGEADNNSGTFPIQSERLFQAIKGNNQAVRYVTLPHESHGYTGRESVEHTLWEMGAWLDRHLKN
jgi:dipeptidyl aminopeptidase/acylaminoacyl peptidase